VKRHLTRLPAMAAAVCTLALLAACGSDDEGGSGSAATATPAAKKLKVAMVTDIGGLNDRSFNALAYKGLKDAQKELGVDIRAVTSKSNADYVPNLSSLARQKYDVVFAVGFLMADATATVAKAFPNTKFAIIDFSQGALKGKPKNVEGLLFKENEAGYLAGYLAGLYVKKQGGDQVISTVGGQKIPPVDGYIAGYQAGAKAANPEIKTLNAYSQDFVDQAKCKELALNQIEEGSQVVFQVAGQCGLGALDAAKEKGVEGIGVDADQAYIGSFMLTSALKKIDEAVVKTIKDTQADGFKAGTDTLFDVKSNGVGLGKVSSDGEPFADQIEEVRGKIAAGEIKDIPAKVK
jgi:basic membrane protein A and related proteins